MRRKDMANGMQVAWQPSPGCAPSQVVQAEVASTDRWRRVEGLRDHVIDGEAVSFYAERGGEGVLIRHDGRLVATGLHRILKSWEDWEVTRARIAEQERQRLWEVEERRQHLYTVARRAIAAGYQTYVGSHPYLSIPVDDLSRMLDALDAAGGAR